MRTIPVVIAIIFFSAPVAGVLPPTAGPIFSDKHSQFQFESDVNTEILNSYVDSGKFEPDEYVSAQVEVRNTGDREHTFFVGYSAQGPNDNWHDNDGETGTTVTLAPGERRWFSLELRVSDDIPTGEYDAMNSVWRESDLDSFETRLDRQRDNSAFAVVEPPEIDASVVDFDVDSGEYFANEDVEAEVTVQNTGEVEHTFFVGYSLRGPDGGWYDNDGETGEQVRLDPEEQATISLEWTVESDVPEGDYDARTSIWQERGRDNLRNRLDSRRDGGIEVTTPEIDGEVIELEPSSNHASPGGSVSATATVENTGEAEHTFFVDYSVRGPEGNWYDNGEQMGQSVRLNPGEQSVS